MNQTSSAHCPRCGASLDQGSVDGLCAKCLAALNFATDTALPGEAALAIPPPTTEEIAAHFPQLEVIEFLGRGGMGVVYKARQKALGRLVALKLLAPERVADPKFAERFSHEAKALAALNHPSIVTIYDFGQAGGFYYLLMEFVDGVNLRQAMKAGRFTPEQALAVVPPVCEALQYAHEHGIVHRDIKPENLLLDKDGRVKIADFGIAKILGEDSATGLAESQPAGTPQYMAPEQREHQRTDHRADIYSLGVVLYEMLTGELPGAKLQPPSRKVQIDVRLDEIVLRALEKSPALRYQTAGEMRTQVETIAHEAPNVGPRAAASRGSAGAEAGAAIPMPMVEARFSRAAIWGAMWVMLFIAVVPAFLWHELRTHEFEHGRIGSPGAAFAILLILLGFTAPLGSTILGWIAVAQIRRSAGKLYGLGLAVFDGLLFPLLALDALIISADLSGRTHTIGPGLTPGVTMAERNIPGLVVVLLIAIIIVVDFLIIRAVWRAVNDGRPALPGAPTGPAPNTTLSNLAYGLAWASGIFAAITWCLMPQPPMFFVWSILVAALAALAMGIKTRRLPRGKWALWFGLVQCCVWVFFAILFSTGAFSRQQALVEEPGSGPEIERVVVSKDQAVVNQRRFDGEGMNITFGPMNNRWTPRGVYISAMFDVTLESGWFVRGVNWVIKSRPSIYMSHRLDGPPGPMLGKIVFHQGTPSAEADGSYVIGEFRPETGAPLPIAVSLVKDGKQTGSAAQAANEKVTASAANRAPQDDSGSVDSSSDKSLTVAKAPDTKAPAAAAATDSPRKVVAEFLRRIKTEGDAQQVWELTTRSGNASWGSDFGKMVEEGFIHPLHQLGNDEQTLVLSAPFNYQGRERIFSAILLKRDGKWLVDRHDAYRSPAETVSLMDGFLLTAGVKFDVQADELTGTWHFPCASTLTLSADGKGVRVYEGPSGVPEKSERFHWDVSGSTLNTHWLDHTDTATITWVTDNAFRIVDAKGQNDSFDYREAIIPLGSPHEFVVHDPRLNKKEASYFGIDAERRRNNYNDDLTAKFGVADPHQTDAALIAWMKEHRMDAVGRVTLADGKVTQLGLRTFEMLTIPAAADAWEKATPAQVTEQIRARLGDWSEIDRVNDLLIDGNAPATFLFQTREGSQGLLQIIGPAEKNGVKIRYKVTKEA